MVLCFQAGLCAWWMQTARAGKRSIAGTLKMCTLGRGPCCRAAVAVRTKKPRRSGAWGDRRKSLFQRLLGKLNTAPSRTPALGQRWVMVLRLV